MVERSFPMTMDIPIGRGKKVWYTFLWFTYSPIFAYAYKNHA